MSIEKDLKKDGIIVLESLDNSSVISIAKNVSKKIYSAFPSYEFTYDYLLDTLSQVSLYMAKIPEGLSEASYFYKNSSIYFRDGMGIKDIEKFSVHEYIHHLQARKDNKDNLIRMGLCEFSGIKIIGMALNEAAVQIITSNILNYTFDNVDYYGIKFSTISPNVYPLICNLVNQMSYITGEDVLFESTLDANDHFKNKFISLCSEKTYFTVLSNLDRILSAEERIIILSNILQTQDMKENKKIKLNQKINYYKDSIRNLYFDTQNIIISSYCETMYSNLLTLSDIDNFRNHLYNFQDLIGISSDNKTFNDLYVSMMEKLDTKAEIFTGNTYLVPKQDNKFLKIINTLKKIIGISKIDSESEW